jgi:hypothetical protein
MGGRMQIRWDEFLLPFTRFRPVIFGVDILPDGRDGVDSDIRQSVWPGKLG